MYLFKYANVPMDACTLGWEPLRKILYFYDIIKQNAHTQSKFDGDNLMFAPVNARPRHLG